MVGHPRLPINPHEIEEIPANRFVSSAQANAHDTEVFTTMSEPTEARAVAALERLGGGELNQLVTAFFSRQNITYLLDEMPFSVWIKDVNGRFAGANQQWLDENNFSSPQDIMGYDAYEIHEPARAAANVRHDWQMIDADSALTTTNQRERNGQTETVQTTRLPLRNAAKEIIGIMGFSSATALEAEQSSAHQALLDTDPVTGAGSREALDRRITELLASRQPSMLLILSLDDFGVINDSLGHGFGDLLLRSATKRLTTAFGPHLFRHRGDEFAVVLPSLEQAHLDEITEAIIDKWRQPMFIDGTEIYGSISIGLAAISNRTQSSRVLQDAELAVNKAKRSGGNTVVMFTQEHRREADEQLSQQMLVRRAVANREFHLHWQPIFDTQTGQIRGCEALLRWRPAGGSLTLPAADFLPFLERSGLIVQVGKFVIDAACRQHTNWRAMDKVGIPIPIFVNVSHRQFASGTLADDLLSTLQDHSVSPHQLTIEIGDSTTDTATEDIIEDLHRLRTAGVRVAIDNFGVGQTSLASLAELPIDVTKIDRSFVNRIVPGQDDPILDALQSIFRAQNQIPVVQGVENAEQLRWLAERGWECVQGYHLAQPMEADEVTDLLAQRVAAARAA